MKQKMDRAKVDGKAEFSMERGENNNFEETTAKNFPSLMKMMTAGLRSS